MIKLLKRILLKLISILDKVQQKKNMRKSDESSLIQANRVKKWFADKGDETHRLDYDFNENSIVFDIGGYKGEFARDIFCKYNCTIYIFEPIKEFYDIIKKRFINNSKIKAFNFGLGNLDKIVQISLIDDRSSVLNMNGDLIKVKIKSINEFIKNQNIKNIDLVKMNIEGAEYELLESIISENNQIKIENLQIQFHDFVIDNAFDKMKSIQKELVKTHELTYQYEFVWENWKLKDDK